MLLYDHGNETNVLIRGDKMSREYVECPICGDEVHTDETARFQMCLDCFADSIIQNVTETILYDFLREYGREFRDYICDNYEG